MPSPSPAETTPARQRQLRRAAVTLVLTIVLAAFSGLFLYAKEQYQAVRHAYGPWFEGDALAVPDPVIGFAANPEGLSRFFIRGTDRSVAVSADPQGLRVPPGQRHQHIEEADLLAVGCSYTFGWGVEAEQAWPAVAGRSSGQAAANAAVSGYSTLGALLMLERLSSLRPELVVYGYVDVHLWRNLSPCAPLSVPVCRSQARVAITASGPEIRLPEAGGWAQNVTMRLLRDLAQPEGFADGWRGLLMLAAQAASTLTTPRWDDTPENRAAALAFLLQRMKSTAEGMGARLVVVYMPRELPAAGAPTFALAPIPPVLLQALPPGVELVDMTGALAAAAPEGSLRLSPKDTHPSAIAHRAMGEELARRLRDDLMP